MTTSRKQQCFETGKMRCQTTLIPTLVVLSLEFGGRTFFPLSCGASQRLEK